MIQDLLEYRLAKLHVDSFHDSVMKDHRDAMECRDCEDHLEKGIVAVKWVRQAEETISEAIRAGLIEFSPNRLSEIMRALLGAWLKSADKAEEWIGKLSECGHRPGNLEAFRAVASEAREAYELRQWLYVGRASHAALASGEPW